MSYPPCFLCGEVERKDDRWTYTGIIDYDSGKHAHMTCFKEARDKFSYQIDFHPCCKKMQDVAGYKIMIDVFTMTFAVYDPNNDMKYYFNGIKFCPFCGKEIKIGK